MRFRLQFCACAIPLLFHCTTVGFHRPSVRDSIDYGPGRTLRICVFKDTKLSSLQLERIMQQWRAELLPYGIELALERVLPYERTNFSCIGMGNELGRLDLEPPCDRVLIMLKRTPVDFAWSLFLPTVFGAVDSGTGTRGYAFGDLYWLENILFFRADASVLLHEGYHLFGCGHALVLDDCYREIARLKKSWREGADFFPALSDNRTIFFTRDEANRHFFRRERPPGSGN